MSNSRRVRYTVHALILAASLAAANPLPAFANETHRFDVTASNNTKAIQEFAAQSDVQILVPAKELEGKRLHEVSGQFSTDDALNTMLEGTGLSHRYVGERTVALVKKDTTASSQNPASFRNRLHLAQVESSGNAGSSERPTAATEASVETLEEIVVTANKRVERLQDVPSSVTSLRADRLTETGSVKLEDYAARVPGLSVNNLTAGGLQNSVSLRGVTTGPLGSPTVGVFVDDTPLTSSTATNVPDLDPADLERIEVLRGPQGTLYGGGSMGGLIKYVTRAPDYDRFSTRLQVDGSSVANGDYGGGARAAMNAPVTDSIAVRASAFARRDPGFIENLQTGQDDVNRILYDGGRFALGAKLGESFNVRLSAMHQRIRAEGNPVIDIDGTTLQPLYGDLQTRRAPGSDNSHNVNDLYDAVITGDLGFADFVSATSWGENRFESNFDYSPVLSPLIAALFGVDNAGAAVHTTRRVDKFTEEARLSSKSGQTFTWQLGVYYTHESTDLVQDIRVFDAETGGPLEAAIPPLGSVGGPAKFEEQAVFGNVTYAISEPFDVTVGVRYSSNDQSGSQISSGALLGESNARLSASGNSTTFLINPRYRIADNLMVYARVASGYRPGGPNIVVADVPAAFGPDTVVNYETGIKADLFGGTLSFDAAAFYIDWSDIQVRQQSAVATTYYINGGQAHSQGVESSVTWRPTAAVSFNGNVSFTEAALDRDLPQGAALEGARLPDTPRWSGQLSADYTFPIFSNWSSSIGASYRYVGERFAALELDPYRLPAYDTFDLRASLQSDRYLLTLFARNVGDERGYISAFRFGSLQQVAIIQPRTVGISAAVNF